MEEIATTNSDHVEDLPEEHPLTLKASIRNSLDKLLVAKILSKGEVGIIKMNQSFKVPSLTDKVHSIIESARSVKYRRQESKDVFWARRESVTDDLNKIDRVVIQAKASEQEYFYTDYNKYDSKVLRMTSAEFKQRYLHLHIPCIIQNIRIPIAEKWIKEARISNIPGAEAKSFKINTDWFIENIGGDTEVPIRVNQEGYTAGRATECTTSKMTMKKWIQRNQNPSPNPSEYLKDWHLQSLFQHLYKDPILFDDILNPFLLDHEGGDYRFVYWGGKKSSTPIHSDVLNSHSWSYNVIGSKRWTFYRNDSHSGDDNSIVQIDQCQGEMMFVPSTWRHSVLNLEEAISINHNWITICSIDCIFDCLLEEMMAIEEEMQAWDILKSSNQSELSRVRENMLRGCIGMDISTYCALAISCFVKSISSVLKDENDEMHWFNFARSVIVINNILETATSEKSKGTLEDGMGDDSQEGNVFIDPEIKLSKPLCNRKDSSEALKYNAVDFSKCLLQN
ncbi:hypothetical protein CTEN210_07731 [Chaetoceros tenuissimus]|uniref:JmjC domain-containing protein n=1 Tax=Chaetoceros tenuissimus TaxID=426638 RepID=A0AAD3CUP3_9STRA|nr:hypothetical protein CTEN210_07731 [Chaetoceros tenuissimus]